MKMKSMFSTIAILLGLSLSTYAQHTPSGLPADAGLDDIISYALQHHANVQQALIDEQIGEREIASALSEWYPQINANATFNDNIIIPTIAIGDQVIQMGQSYVGALVFQADQQILNPRLIQASKAAKFIRQQNAQNTESSKINTVVEVSKAYYDILTTEEQIKIIHENIQRIEKQLTDANARYEAGIVDKTDFKRAQISLSNTKAELKRNEELRKYKYAFLKELIGLSPEKTLSLSFDNQSMESEVLLDTTTQLNYQQRIEYQQLQTLKQIQLLNTSYQKWTFLPSLSAFYNYAWDYRNNEFSQLFRSDYPRSVFGLTLNLPIFQGTKRLQEMRKSRLQEERLEWDITNLENRINTEHELAMATYIANLNDLRVARENVALSEEVYDTIKLQYDEGIKTYLDLMTAETDLRTSQIYHLNALYAVLSGKLDVQRALGTVDTNIDQ